MPETPPQAAPEPRCSECNRPLVDQPCGFVHAVVRMQVGLIRTVLTSLLEGDRRA